MFDRPNARRAFDDQSKHPRLQAHAQVSLEEPMRLYDAMFTPQQQAALETSTLVWLCLALGLEPG